MDTKYGLLKNKQLKPNYDKFPLVHVSDDSSVTKGWTDIFRLIRESHKRRIVIDCYHGVDLKELQEQVRLAFSDFTILFSDDALKSESELIDLLAEEMTDDRVFGKMSSIELVSYFEASKMSELQAVYQASQKRVLLFGTGASLFANTCDLLIYADMARWEIQQRFRRKELGNIGLSNFEEDFLRRYKRGYFADWRACDRHKMKIFESVDYFLDTNNAPTPKLVPARDLFDGLKKTTSQPFRVVPFFDPGPWGGQWMKEVCDLDRSAENYAWCFDCVPEENSLLLQFGEDCIEIPSINLVLFHPEELLGSLIHEKFGAEFPIRFDFLDTIKGGNLSLQVHPLVSYIREHFRMPYTQDESYYLLDAEEDAVVYLGLKDGIDPNEMVESLAHAQSGGPEFPAEDFVNKFPVKKHDHVLIPAGTIHCSGKGSMVLEISATPYIFTFKLWDWGRLGMDGKPRPIHLEHGKNVIQWDRREDFVFKELVNHVEPLMEGQGWREERTGLHPLEFIETRRHWFTEVVPHDTEGNLNVLNLIEGRCAMVESPTGAFPPFEIHYAETFIVPAQIGAYTITPHGESIGKECATLKAFVRS